MCSLVPSRALLRRGLGLRSCQTRMLLDLGHQVQQLGFVFVIRIGVEEFLPRLQCCLNIHFSLPLYKPEIE